MLKDITSESSRRPDPIQVKDILPIPHNGYPVSPRKDSKEIETQVIPQPSGSSRSIRSTDKLLAIQYGLIFITMCFLDNKLVNSYLFFMAHVG